MHAASTVLAKISRVGSQPLRTFPPSVSSLPITRSTFRSRSRPEARTIRAITIGFYSVRTKLPRFRTHRKSAKTNVTRRIIQGRTHTYYEFISNVQLSSNVLRVERKPPLPPLATKVNSFVRDAHVEYRWEAMTNEGTANDGHGGTTRVAGRDGAVACLEAIRSFLAGGR